MRQLPIAGLAATVVLAVAAMAQAATVGRFTNQAPGIPGPVSVAPSSTSGVTGNTTTQAPQNTTAVDQRAQATRQATSSAFASGSTSSLGPLAGTATTTFGTGSTSGAGATGTAGTPTGVTTGTGVAAFGSVGTAVGVPVFATSGDVTSGAAPVTTLAASTTPTFTNADIVANAQLAQNGIVVTDTLANGANVDRAIAQVQRDRKRIGRNGQLLYSVAPRTNVDRTWQMPDDGPGLSLNGMNSTLAQ